MRNLILLAFGIVLTILFLIFPTQVYEDFYFSQGFSDAMYNGSMYIVVAIITAAIAWVAAVIYYYVINSVKFDRWWHWLIILVITILLAPTVSWAYTDYDMAQQNYMYDKETFYFELLNMCVAAVLFIIASFSIRWWSSNCRHTPIPQ
jgi:hypothetical protein